MINCLALDDEPLALDIIEAYVKKHPELRLVARCNNTAEASEILKKQSIDLMFLDIQMPGINGFEVVKALQADLMPMVIFVTAFDQYAVDAFDLHAVDYILKPLDKERVTRSIERAIDRIKSDQEQSFKTPLIGAIESISERVTSHVAEAPEEDVPSGIKRKLVVRDSGVVKVIPFDDIDWVDAAGDYMCVHALGETHIVRTTLTELIAKLDDSLFVRIHRSTIVNIERVVSVSPLQKGGNLLHLKGGEELKVSRNYREAIRNLFQ